MSKPTRSSTPGAAGMSPEPPDGPGEEKPVRRPGGRFKQDFSTQSDLHLDPITRNLRRAFDEVAAEPLTDELAELLRQIEDKESSGGANGR